MKKLLTKCREVSMKKIFIALALVLTVLLGGCAKGEITLDINRWGAADLSCKIVTAPVISGVLTSFKDDFKQDGYMVTEAQDGDMTGFLAQKHYNHLQDIKDSKVLETFRFAKIQKAAQDAQKSKSQNPTSAKPANPSQPTNPAQPSSDKSAPLVAVKEGWLLDTVTVHTGLNMKDDKRNDQVFDDQFIMKNILKEINLKFILKLPTKTENNNATTVSADGKTLTWVLPMGENTPIDMTFTYVNPIKAASWLGILAILVIAGVFFRSYKKSKKNKEKIANEQGTGK